MYKVLIYDIETAPNVALVWRAWKQNVGHNQMLKTGHVMSFAAKWLGEDDIIYMENRDGNDKEIIEAIVELLDEADIVIAHNGVGFDGPWVNGRALVHNILPPSPYKWIDTLLTARKEFMFPHNSLEALADYLNCKHRKGAHKKFPGFQLWLECLKGNPEAWEEMGEYNRLDVMTLEDVYLKMRPWIRNHPNVGVFTEGEDHVCPKCGGKHLQRRGFYYTNVQKYQRFRCNDCGSWSRTRFTEYNKDNRKALLGNAT